MTDPFSISAGAPGIVSIGITAIDGLLKFYKDYKHQDDNVAHVYRKLGSLGSILRELSCCISNNNIQANLAPQIVEDAIVDCEELIDDLCTRLKKFQRSPQPGLRSIVSQTTTRVTYPFRRETLEGLGVEISALQSNVDTALHCLQLKSTAKLQTDLEASNSILHEIRQGQISHEIQEWLRAPDTSSHLNDNRKKTSSSYWLVVCGRRQVSLVAYRSAISSLAEWFCWNGQVDLAIYGYSIHIPPPKIRSKRWHCVLLFHIQRCYKTRCISHVNVYCFTISFSAEKCGGDCTATSQCLRKCYTTFGGFA